MLGQAALAMWWDMAPAMREEFEHWHSHEHFPERLALPGFRRANRFAAADGGEGFFVLYELASHAALVSPEYLARLNAPSEWSRRLMPHHRHMVRSQCRVLGSRGAVAAGHVLTVRLAPAPGQDERLHSHVERLVVELPGQAGCAGLHLLRNEAPVIAPTTEQKIRGLADQAADWILLATGYDPAVPAQLQTSALSPARLEAAGAAPGVLAARYTLRLSALPGELHPATA